MKCVSCLQPNRRGPGRWGRGEVTSEVIITPVCGYNSWLVHLGMSNKMSNVYPVIQLETKYVWNDISESADTFYRSFATDVIAASNQALPSVLQ